MKLISIIGIFNTHIIQNSKLLWIVVHLDSQMLCVCVCVFVRGCVLVMLCGHKSLYTLTL